MKVIVISECGLTNLSLNIIVQGIKSIVGLGRRIKVDSYYAVENQDIYNQLNNRDVIILDVENIPPVFVLKTISQIRDSSPLAYIMVLFRKNEKTDDIICLSEISDGILCKTASIERIENLIINLLTSRKVPKIFDKSG
ncbi:helix-turn-helix transcriptional regulator, partial [Yersinia massiliensis]